MVTPGTWEWEFARLLGAHWYAIETLVVFAVFVTWRRLRKASQEWKEEALTGGFAVLIGWMAASWPGYPLLKAALDALGVFDSFPFFVAVTLNLLTIDVVLLASAVALAKSNGGRPRRGLP